MSKSKVERIFDIVVFGASGVTGKYVMEELINHHPNVKWAAAGRSKERLQASVTEVMSYSGKTTSEIEIIEADVNSKDSLIDMCSKTKLVINCVGPFRFFGEKVVKAAIECGTHHLDVSGEPQFLENMQLRYFDDAKEKNVFVVGSCGFDSVPCDNGVQFTKHIFEGDVQLIETYLQFSRMKGATGNFATWQSAIYGVAHSSELKGLRKKMKEKFFKKTVSGKIPNKSVLFKHKELNSWCVPFIGSDKSVIYRTQMYNFNTYNERPVEVKTYLAVGSFTNAIIFLFFGMIFMLLVKFAYGRYLLEQFPEFFSGGLFSKIPPPREEDDKSSYSFTFEALGWENKLLEPTDQHNESPNKALKLVLQRCDNGYESTAICVVSSAMTILENSDKLPETGGVFTPGTLFPMETGFFGRLKDRGISFQVLS